MHIAEEPQQAQEARAPIPQEVHLPTVVLVAVQEAPVPQEVLVAAQEATSLIEAQLPEAVITNQVAEAQALEVVAVTEALEVVLEAQEVAQEVRAVHLGRLVEDHLPVQVEVVEEDSNPERLNPLF